MGTQATQRRSNITELVGDRLRLPRGLLANRPADPEAGDCYYATDTDQLLVGLSSGAWRVFPLTEEDLTAQVDEITDSFTTGSAYEAGTLRVFWNDLRQCPAGSGDFVEVDPAAGTFQLTNTPDLGDSLTVEYHQRLT